MRAMILSLFLFPSLSGCEGELDSDGDGWPDHLDCDPFDPEVYPGAPEICDGKDNNCNGTIDGPEAIDRRLWYRDCDGDGRGDPEFVVRACDQPLGFVANNDDDDDTSNPQPGCNP